MSFPILSTPDENMEWLRAFVFNRQRKCNRKFDFRLRENGLYISAVIYVPSRSMYWNENFFLSSDMIKATSNVRELLRYEVAEVLHCLRLARRDQS